MSGNAYIPEYLTTRYITVMPGTLRKSPPPNMYDGCLAQDHLLWDELAACGGLTTVCCPKGRKPYLQKPWIAMPKEGRRFKPVGIVAVADLVFDGTDQVILSVRNPMGYNGVITDVVCEVSATGGSGFVEGSGDVTWRLAADNRYLRDMGNIKVSLGSLTTPGAVPRGGLRTYSHDLINFYANLAVGAEARINPAARIICSVTGWWWPR